MKTPTNSNQKVRCLTRMRELLKRKAPRRSSRKRRHMIPANLTRESQWESGGEPPQVRTSRMFIGMLSLHLVAAIGLVAFHYFGHDPAPKMMSQKTAPALLPVSPAIPAAPTVPAPTTSAKTPATAAMEGAMSDHIVRMDETWSSIAAARGLTVEELQAANPGVDCNVGRLLMLPPTPKVISAAPLASKNTKTTIPPRAVVVANDPKKSVNRYAPNPDLAPEITLPPVPVPHTMQVGSPVKASAVVAPVSVKIHIVAKGETIFGIAKRYRINEKTLMKYNGLSDAIKIRPGQKLKMPNPN